MADNRGTIGVIELETGAILAMVHKPSYDPNLFGAEFDEAEWEKLTQNPANPLHNKFLQGQYSPGSVFKLVVALAGLQEKIITSDTTVFCTGSERIYDRNFSCWVSYGHGSMNIFSAIQNSCNIYFYQMGKKLNVDVIAEYARYLGLGASTNIDLPHEMTGLVPTRKWKLEKQGQTWYPGETISVAIGHGPLNVTPVQILQLMATIALKGRMPQLHIMNKITQDGKTVKQFQSRFSQVPIEQPHFDAVIEGMYRVVNAGGTGRAAKVDDLNICGKTGTSQIITKENPHYRDLVKQKRFRPHSWFASFAPKSNPKFAMVVFIENGGDGGAIAAPLAAKIYEYILNQ